MNKKNYEIPLCESVKLAFESAVLAASAPDQLGLPGMPGNDLGVLDPLTF
ncbi:MAG: hypothetical protein J5917_06235 [Bacteroidales bacterium]|nr:hypothetical protein [Bacteroidales bacterium]